MSENAVDRGFKAKYRILQWVYGDYSNPSIEFLVYDHYGWPGFSNYINSLLFVSQHNGKFYHEKYLYNDVYATIDGRWASPFNDTYLQ